MLGKNDFLFDKRLTERLIKRGSLTRAELETYLKGLPDVASKGEILAAADSDPTASSGSQETDADER